MVRTRFIAIVAAFLIALVYVAATPAQANEPTRSGLFIGFGVGGGGAKLDSDLDYEGGIMANFRAGWALADNVTIGLENSLLLYDENDDITVTFSTTTVGVTFYPGNMGIFVKGGVGLGSVEWSSTIDGTTFTITENGFGLLTGIGYEHRMTTKFALGVEGNYSYMNVTDELSGTKFAGANLIFNWYW